MSARVHRDGKAALRTEWRPHGLRGTVRRRGWRFVAALVAVYLVRDLVLYVGIPAAVWMAAAH